ncbi:MAG: hypothetical protein BKP49_01480 [Treponema sp. CETP13]|nr:MAG: hypothetical protein BKP49_01480 [Treponema sp. CETP13]
MDKKIYVIGLDSDDIKAKAEEVVKTVEGINSVVANTDKAQILVSFDESISDIEPKINSAIESVGLTVLNK